MNRNSDTVDTPHSPLSTSRLAKATLRVHSGISRVKLWTQPRHHSYKPTYSEKHCAIAELTARFPAFFHVELLSIPPQDFPIVVHTQKITC